MDESFPIETHKNTAVDELVEDKNISLTEVDDERRCYHHDPEAVCNSVSRKSAAGDEKTDDASLCVKVHHIEVTPVDVNDPFADIPWIEDDVDGCCCSSAGGEDDKTGEKRYVDSVKDGTKKDVQGSKKEDQQRARDLEEV